VRTFKLQLTVKTDEASDTPETVKAAVEEVIGMAGLLPGSVEVQEVANEPS
jgi:DNA-directed RNA polymerase subunit L